MSPTAAGRYCANCATEVVDFTAFSIDEIWTYMAQHRGQQVCALAHTHQLASPGPPAPVPAWRRWIVAGLAVLGLSPAAADSPAPLIPPPSGDFDERSRKSAPQVIVRGQVFDDLDGRPAPGIRVMIKDTKYGTTANEEGKFELIMAASFEPLKSGTLLLVFSGSPFLFKQQTVAVNVSQQDELITLNVQMNSFEERGELVGKIAMPEPPIAPPSH